MKHTKAVGIHGSKEYDVFRFDSYDDAKNHKSDCPNWKFCLKDIQRFMGKVWMDKEDIRFFIDGHPVYRKYIIVGFEDNNAWSDYYWILEPINGGKEVYKLWNTPDFKKGIIYDKKKKPNYGKKDKKFDKKNMPMGNRRRPKKVSDK